MKFYHYTDLDRLDSIKSRGLIPHSNPLLVAQGLPDEALTETVKSMRDRKYIVALGDPIPSGWVDSGLYNNILRHVMIDVGFSAALFEFDVEDTQEVYVRDHGLFTPTDHTKMLKITDENALQRRDYLNSTIPLSQYQGNFRAPEFWIPSPQSNPRRHSLPQRAIDLIRRINGH